MKCYCAINKKEDERRESTSGGVFSLLCREILKLDGVVYGAAYTDQHHVKHIKVTSEEELCRIRGAKYAPSSLKGIFAEVRTLLEQERWVLFSGTPCQVYSLKKYLKKEYETLILTDLVCHGLPAVHAWEHYLEYRQQMDGQTQPPTSINMRSKVSGWSRYQYSVHFQYPSGYEYVRCSQEDSYMVAYVYNMILRTACTHCRHKGLDRVSDFTLGDFWGVWDYVPHMDDNLGTSLVLVHSERGTQLWNKLEDQLFVEEISPEAACSQNPSVNTISESYPKREELLAVLKTEGWEPVEAEVTAFRAQQEKYLQEAQKKKPFHIRVCNKIRRCLNWEN